MQRPLLLNGCSTSAKSLVGASVARTTGRPFVDLDASRDVASVSEQSAGMRYGAEERSLETVLGPWRSGSSPAPVVALRSDTLVVRSTRLVALDEAVVVTLDVAPAPGSAEALATELRSPGYAEAHARVAVAGRETGSVCSDVLRVWERDPIVVAAAERSYTVDIGAHSVGSRLSDALGSPSMVLLVSDSNVEPLHGAAVRQAIEAAGHHCVSVTLPAGEEHKNLDTMRGIWEQALVARADRRSVFVGLGGGVVTDVTGFAAAAWMRGVRWVALPTTLLGMVDASVGGKTAVDLLSAKNAVGAFWQPHAVVCDVSLLVTEPQRGYTGALAEVVKTGLIGDPVLLDLLESRAGDVRAHDARLVSELVRRSLRVKARVVSLDECESGHRATLNLGHTVGHALEAEAGYTGLSHGEAVSLGLVAVLRIGQKQGWTPAPVVERTIALLGALGLPVALDRGALGRAVALIAHDKKRAGKTVKLAVVREAGQVALVPVPVDDLCAWCVDLTR
ncbi:MAG: 3-dehydroquinate synthase [Polyangiaceae bacterium]|nr:3-dehydroquinate synthase [Polyangiaceae bacterium]